MKIYKTYADKEDWFETTVPEFEKRFQDRDFGDLTALQALKSCGTLRTTFAFYSLKPSF